MPSTEAPRRLQPPAAVAEYMEAMFRHLIGKGDAPAFPTTITDLQLLCDCDHIAAAAAAAYRNPVEIPWDIDRYRDRITIRQTGRNPQVEDKLSEAFPPPFQAGLSLQVLERPAVLHDKHGSILVWYMPGAFGRERQRLLWESFQSLQTALKIDGSKGSWRVCPDNFHDTPEMKGGEVNLSPGWHQSVMTHELPETSATLQSPDSPCRRWLETNTAFMMLTGGILRISHPAEYQLGVTAGNMLSQEANTMRKSPDRQTVFNAWSSPFTALSIISNRETLAHRDTGGRFEWFDLLATFGQYENATLDLPGLGLRLRYRSGTAVAIAGRALVHKVDRVKGNRVCVAMYMRDAIHHQLGLPACGWAKMSMYG